MKILWKWNYDTHSYDEYDVPDDRDVKLYVRDNNEVYHCANCGKEITNNSAYCSLEIHTNYGIGYLVCPQCYAKELERKYKNNETI